MKRWIKFCLIACLCPLLVHSQQQPDSIRSPIKKKQLRIATVSAGGLYTLGLVGLNHLWYRNTERQSFRFFNDNAEWKQVDKIGHLYSSFYISYAVARGLRSFQVPPQRADITASLVGFGVLVPIEIFDGFSDAYGASVGDLVADAAGSLLYYGQSSLWGEVRLFPKFSFHETRYASLRPEVLGQGMEQLIKDYNGQTYWLSVDLDKFFRSPKWLNVALGYGANGMVYARDHQNLDAGYALPQRQYFVSLDLDLSAIPARSKGVRTILFVLNMIKIPSPTLELSGSKFKFHGFYF